MNAHYFNNLAAYIPTTSRKRTAVCRCLLVWVSVPVKGMTFITKWPALAHLDFTVVLSRVRYFRSATECCYGTCRYGDSWGRFGRSQGHGCEEKSGRGVGEQGIENGLCQGAGGTFGCDSAVGSDTEVAAEAVKYALGGRLG